MKSVHPHNAHGELATITSSESTLTEYVRNNQGKIESVTLPNGDQITYILDHRDRRVAKYKNGALVYKRLYQNELQMAMQINADGSVSEFIYATRINVPDLIKRDGQTYRVIMDHLGSPVLVVNIADGTILDQAEYNEWGRVIAQTNPTFTPFGFAGGLEDQDTKLVRFGARDYSPQVGRWISKDPIGFSGGDANLYRYVGNDPINRLDPNGLDWVYSQSTGNLGREDSTKNMSYEVSNNGYSGAPGTVNSSSSQHLKNRGPIPRGTYKIDKQQDNVTNKGTNLPASMRLIPDKDNEMFDRNGFLIHGDNTKRNQSASRGCIIFEPNVRNEIGRSGDTILRVVR